jgi:hypothetical protein
VSPSPHPGSASELEGIAFGSNHRAIWTVGLYVSRPGNAGHPPFCRHSSRGDGFRPPSHGTYNGAALTLPKETKNSNRIDKIDSAEELTHEMERSLAGSVSIPKMMEREEIP